MLRQMVGLEANLAVYSDIYIYIYIYMSVRKCSYLCVSVEVTKCISAFLLTIPGNLPMKCHCNLPGC
jgi:hypothetical protein